MTPIEKFNQYLIDEQRGEVWELCKIWGEGYVRDQIPRMRSWLLVHGHEKRAHKKNWKKFIHNWLARQDEILAQAILARAKVEKAHEFTKKRWTGTSDFEQVDD